MQLWWENITLDRMICARVSNVKWNTSVANNIHVTKKTAKNFCESKKINDTTMGGCNSIVCSDREFVKNHRRHNAMRFKQAASTIPKASSKSSNTDESSTNSSSSWSSSLSDSGSYIDLPSETLESLKVRGTPWPPRADIDSRQAKRRSKNFLLVRKRIANQRGKRGWCEGFITEGARFCAPSTRAPFQVHWLHSSATPPITMEAGVLDDDQTKGGGGRRDNEEEGTVEPREEEADKKRRRGIRFEKSTLRVLRFALENTKFLSAPKHSWWADGGTDPFGCARLSRLSRPSRLS